MKLLFIKANPKPTELSIGLTVGEAFLKAYKEKNPNDVITEINLFERFVPEVDKNMLVAWSALEEGKEFTNLNLDQQKQLNASNEILTEFLNHDKYVFITPLWNFMFPARLKSYLDALCVSGKTFHYTKNGVEGLVKNKKALHIHASGGVYKGAYADRYLKEILNFIGIEDMKTLLIEGHEEMPDKGSEIISQGKDKASKIGREF
ncbi:MAG: NAD(P)H-dependent oxidoreductase [Erysipelotrichales bacterium]|nr:NAD(P)H-dependent oxidoreductase [Erysipelotrichales bacterium]